MVANGVAVDDEQVFPTVEVHVEERRAPADVLLRAGGEAGLDRLVAEEHDSGPNVVAVQSVILLFVVGDPQRRPAAAVVVARIPAHAAVGLALPVAGGAAGLPGPL